MADSNYRIERDSMGELQVPEQALWGAQTQRAVDNFPISGIPMPRGFIRALGLIKWAAAGANAELGLLKSRRAMAIQAAALEVGRRRDAGDEQQPRRGEHDQSPARAPEQVRQGAGESGHGAFAGATGR